MRNLLTACLPALALFALGGCASTSGLVSSEDDGVYYSAKDRTTAVVRPAPAPASTDEAANPDYNGSSSSSTARQGSGSDQYYDESYTYMQGLRNTTPGVSYYVPYSPYTSLSYGVGAFGGYGGGFGGYSPYGYGGGFNDPFYSPFYSPYGSFYSPYGYGSGLSISFGFGRPFGYGGFGGYGYGGGFYDPFFYGGPFYGGYYGRGGYYGNNYYGGNYNGGNYYGGNYNNGYNGNSRYDNNGGNRTYGHRTDRASDGRYSSGNGVSAPGTVTSTPNGGGRMRTEGRAIMDPSTGPQTMPSNGSDSRRVRADAVSTAPNADPTRADGFFNKPRRMNTEGPVVGTIPGTDQATRDNGRGRLRSNDGAQPSMQPQEATAQPEGQRRGGFFQRAFPQPEPNSGQAAEQPARQRSYDQPRQRTYEQPQQRTYEQPQQQQRTYEQPQRSYSQPSAPSYGGGGGGNSGGGNSGGGGGGRRGRD